MHELCHIHPTSHSEFGTFTSVLFHPPPVCLKSTLYCTLPAFPQQRPSNPNLPLRPLGYYTHFFTDAWANRSTSEFYGTSTGMGSFQRVWNVLNEIWELWNRHHWFIYSLGTKHGVTGEPQGAQTWLHPQKHLYWLICSHFGHILNGSTLGHVNSYTTFNFGMKVFRSIAFWFEVLYNNSPLCSSFLCSYLVEFLQTFVATVFKRKTQDFDFSFQ